MGKGGGRVRDVEGRADGEGFSFPWPRSRTLSADLWTHSASQRQGIAELAMPVWGRGGGNRLHAR